MRVKCEMFIEDIERIQKQIDVFKASFPHFDIISKTYIPDDVLTEWDGEPGDFFEVEFEFQSMNHFWTMAKRVGVDQYKNESDELR